ncbi:MAG: exosome complex protein Rrp42 [archaeon]
MTLKINKDHILENLSKGKRLDSRKLDEYRKIKITTGISTKAEGSAMVTIGETMVVAGIKMTTAEPYPDTPDEGVMTTSAEYLPMGAPEFESGPPREAEIVLGRVVDRAIRESKCIDFRKLCIKPKEKVWMVFVDIFVMNHDGNLFDACGIAAIAALKDAKIPAIVDDKVDHEKLGARLPIKGTPISINVKSYNGKYIFDTNANEEDAITSQITVGTNSDGTISSLQKGGSDGFTKAQVMDILKLTMNASEKIRKAHFAAAK